ncbi:MULTISPECIES: hypothetical protein [Streptomyces]|uniref:hypothetical protein n=1 Tax=Streptomyces TaxID=1883 RepID=UPI00131CB44F|nr:MULTISPECIES: hypothetical protein [Streptomyces]
MRVRRQGLVDETQRRVACRRTAVPGDVQEQRHRDRRRREHRPAVAVDDSAAAEQ